MFPLIRFVTIFGGVAASAQIASGCVRAVKQLCHGRPVVGLLELCDGMAAPVMTAVGEMSKFVKEVHDAVTLPWKQEEPREETLPPVNRCTQEPKEQERELLNGVVTGVKS